MIRAIAQCINPISKLNNCNRLFTTIAPSVYIHPMTYIVGDVTIGENSSVWPFVSMRGDVNKITIGARTSVQDGSVIHVTGVYAETPEKKGSPTKIGSDVTVGHKAMLHGCTIGDRVLVGMGATVLDDAIVEDDTIVGAGSLVPPGKRLTKGLWVGRPAKRVRDLSHHEYVHIM
eukprot:GHVR01179440.1.p1 GENE.GHVR01179440.1~~GHVR01179440.1.p1  ORF type:complete len:174 (+),score=31.05 GHVR01179440.1:35-556(+)